MAVLIATIYALYYVKVQAGWLGVFLSINLAFVSNDVLSCLIQWYDNLSERTTCEEHKESEPFTENLSTEYEYSTSTDEEDKLHSCKSSSKPATSSFVEKLEDSAAKLVVKEEVNSVGEMKRILSSADHYEALGFPRHKKVDFMLLKKEYRKKVSLVWHCQSNCLSCLYFHIAHVDHQIPLILILLTLTSNLAFACICCMLAPKILVPKLRAKIVVFVLMQIGNC